MPEDFLSPDAYLPEDNYDADPRALYQRARRPPGGGATVGVHVNPPTGAVAHERTFFGTLNPRYATPRPQENVTPTAPTIAPSESPNRGGFNQAEGLVRPDYSRGDDLRRQAYELQHPSWWKKLVNGDEGLARQAAHKYALAQYEDMAAENKFRFDNPGMFQKAEKPENVAPGHALVSPTTGKEIYRAPAAPKERKYHQFQSNGKLWKSADDSTDAEPVRMSVPDMPGPNPDGSAGYTGRGAQLDAPEKEFADKAKQSKEFQDKDGHWWEKVFDPTSGKTEVRSLEKLPPGSKKDGKGGPGGPAGQKDWTPQELGKVADNVARQRKRAEATMDPRQMQSTEDDIKRELNTRGLVEDPLTGEITKREAGTKATAIPDLKNPPRGTIRTDRKTKQKEIYLNGKWQPFTGTGKGK